MTLYQLKTLSWTYENWY